MRSEASLSRKIKWFATWFALVSLLPHYKALATNGMEMAGFGARASAMGGAMCALGEDATSLAENPAALSLLTSQHLDVGVAILCPFLSFENVLNSTNANRDTHEALYGLYPLPLFAYAQPSVSRPELSWGIGFFVPGGLGADYTLRHELWPSGISYHSQLIYTKLIGGISYRLSKRLSAGAGLNLGFGWMDMWQPFATEPDFAQGATEGTIAHLIAPRYGDVFRKMGYDEVTCLFTMRQATSLGVGITIGLHYLLNEHFSIGLSYTSPMRLRWRAKSTMDLTHQFMAAASRFGMPVDLAFFSFGLSSETGLIEHPEVRYWMDWPQKISGGVALQLTNRAIVAFELTWINWAATMDRFVMNFSSIRNPNFIKMLGANSCQRSILLDWKDQYVLALGGSYAISERLTVRAGYNYGRNPIPSATALPTFPAIVEHHIALGIGKRWPTFELNLALEHAVKKRLATKRSFSARAFDASRNELSEYLFTITFSWPGAGKNQPLL